jgi:hypothetical protein
MAKFRKKPVVIEAMQFTGPNVAQLLFWFGENATGQTPKPAAVLIDGEWHLKIRTLESGEGYHVADPGDWIICGVHNEFYPCKPDIFAKTYEPEVE